MIALNGEVSLMILKESARFSKLVDDAQEYYDNIKQMSADGVINDPTLIDVAFGRLEALKDAEKVALELYQHTINRQEAAKAARKTSAIKTGGVYPKVVVLVPEPWYVRLLRFTKQTVRRFVRSEAS